MTWDLMRASGLVLLVLFSLVTALGVASAGAKAGGVIPAVVPRSLHRDLALLSMLLLTLHVVTAVLDSYVEVSWLAVVVPGTSAYEPLWVGLGAVVVDVWLAIALTTALRQRLGRRAWRAVHLMAYAAWPAAVAHAIGVGTDLKSGSTLGLALTAGSVALVVAAGCLRLGLAAAHRTESA